jgi:hypothetical protein
MRKPQEESDMPNMSYCRFENTSGDLRDCVDAMVESITWQDLDLSSTEYCAYRYMRSLCQQFLEEYDRLSETMHHVLDE